jgi:hypothetical protein
VFYVVPSNRRKWSQFVAVRMMADPDSTLLGGARCALCGAAHNDPDFASGYVTMVCHECDGRAVDVDGGQPRHESSNDGGDNPVFIDGYQCWRRYKFGRYVTMRDSWNSRDAGEFYDKVIEA